MEVGSLSHKSLCQNVGILGVGGSWERRTLGVADRNHMCSVSALAFICKLCQRTTFINSNVHLNKEHI